MPFQITPNVRVKRDGAGRVRQLRHLQQPYRPEGLAGRKPAALAHAYIRDVAPIYDFPEGFLDDVSNAVERELRDEGPRLRSLVQKDIGGTTVLGFQQTALGLPVWEAHFTVRLQNEPLRATSSESSIHYDVEVTRPSPNAEYLPGTDTVRGLLEEIVRRREGKLVGVTAERLLVYRFDPERRIDPEIERESREEFEGALPTLPLPNVPRTIRPDAHYVATEVLFTTALGPWPALHWRMMIEVETGTVLYLRAFITSAFGNVLEADLMTLSGDVTITACSAGAVLDPLTDVVSLPGLTAPSAGDPQPLDGEYVTLGELANPTIAAPTAALPAGNFSFSATTADFAAVNAYYHCDALFRMMVDMGFDLPTYFLDTTFPLTVDHRDASLGTVNARGYGNATGNGAGGMGFNLVESGCDLGIAADLRVVLHEFCHELLWEHVSSPNFGFSHSAGDSLAAILLDPGSNAPDRFRTFPSVPLITRRHDRDVAAGWAWGGTQDDTAYDSEQILSTTLFRTYRSIGGDSGNLGRREFAARYMAYLIIKGIGMLTATTTDPEVYANALMDSDTSTALFDGAAGGAIHKVVRWSFEQQGLYQPTGAPTPVASEGAPPEVDVYIDDGRNGEYQYLGNFWNTTAIWNRLSTTAGTEIDHETPVVGTQNYLFVRVRNRGTQAASNVVVRTYHCIPATGLVFPDDWVLTTTGELPVPGTIPPGGDAVAGPFEWTPQVIGHECLLATVSADGDVSNIDPAGMLPAATGPSPHWWVVPNDNNIAQRNVAPVPGGGGGLQLAAAFEGRAFVARNPNLEPARVELVAVLPDFLRERGWSIGFANPGGAAFTLPPRGSREVVIALGAGADFRAEDVPATGAQIDILAQIDGIVVGGMSYAIDPHLEHPPVEELPPTAPRDCGEAAGRLLECLEVPHDRVKRVCIKRIDLSIDLESDCC